MDKKTFSKIKNHADYHPQKMTAMCLCMGAKLNLDETRDLLARAGYALSPCDKTVRSATISHLWQTSMIPMTSHGSSRQVTERM